MLESESIHDSGAQKTVGEDGRPTRPEIKPLAVNPSSSTNDSIKRVEAEAETEAEAKAEVEKDTSRCEEPLIGSYFRS